jgi:THO complex subunit 3
MVAASDEKTSESHPKLQLRSLDGHRKKVTSLAWSGGTGARPRLASASMDSTIKIWSIEVHSDCKAEKAESDLKGHLDYVVACSWQPRSNDTLASLATSDKDKTCRLWDVRTSRQVQSFPLTPGNVDLCFSPDGQTIAVSNNRDNTIVMLDLRKGKAQGKPYKYSPYGSPYKIRWMSSNPDLLLVGSSEGSVNVHSLPDLTLNWSLSGHTGSAVYSFDVNQQETRLASGGGDGIISIWDLDAISCIKTITRADGPIKDISISSCGNYLAYVSEPLPSGQESGSHNGVIDILSLSGEVLSSAPFRGSLEACCWSSSHMLLAFSEETRSRDGDPAAIIHICAPPRGNV